MAFMCIFCFRGPICIKSASYFMFSFSLCSALSEHPALHSIPGFCMIQFCERMHPLLIGKIVSFESRPRLHGVLYGEIFLSHFNDRMD